MRVIAETEIGPEPDDVQRAGGSVKGKNKDQTVVIGAHLDSVIEGPGINDNGSGTSTILEIAEEMSEVGYNKKKLQRQVRFALWGAEESNLLGSPNYVRFVYDGDGSDSEAGPARVRRSKRSSTTTSPARVWRPIHQACDDITNLNTKALFEMGDAAPTQRSS